jgi:Uncharacterized alpha/beta hydrolase domain (DUF2235)
MTNVIAPKVRAVENMVARAQAVTKQGNTQGACLTCQAKLWITFFFDGTGNHRDLHFPAKHSNVAALFDAHLDSRSDGIAAFYYEGIGMPFEFKDRPDKQDDSAHAGGGSRYELPRWDSGAIRTGGGPWRRTRCNISEGS